VLFALVLGCAQAPSGPRFEWAPPPPPNRGRVYVYRSDPRPSMSAVRVTVNGQEIGRFRDREYATMELAAGSHRLNAGMRSLAFVAWGWNEHTFRVRPGETRFIELSVRLEERGVPGPGYSRDLEIAGRPEGAASENVFILDRPQADAEAILPTTRLIATPP